MCYSEETPVQIQTYWTFKVLTIILGGNCFIWMSIHLKIYFGECSLYIELTNYTEGLGMEIKKGNRGCVSHEDLRCVNLSACRGHVIPCSRVGFKGELRGFMRAVAIMAPSTVD